LTQLSPYIQTELFPGAVMARPGIMQGRDTSEYAGRFAALLDMAGAAQGAPVFGAEAAFPPPENAPFSPVREPDQFYDSRPPDAAQPAPLKAETTPESGGASPKTGDARPEDGVEEAGASAQAEDQAAFLNKGAEAARAEGFAAKGREAEKAGNAKKAENAKDAETARGGTKQGREKAKIPGEDAENMPALEEGLLVNPEPLPNQKAVISGEPEEADDDAGNGVRVSLFARGEKPEKPDTLISGETAPALSPKDAAARAEISGDSGAEASGAQGELPGGDAEFLEAEAAAAAETGLESAGVELAAAPRQKSPTAPERVEKEGREEPGEAKKPDRRRLNLELRDFRTALKADAAVGNGDTESGRAPGDYPQNHGQEREIVVDLKSQARSQAEVSYNRESRSQFSFRETLARELHENLNGDIVRHASVILKNGGEGLIRLSLRPEHLGNVKIRLEMSENKVVGRIVVESGEALRAFEQELRSLEQAFRDSGFEGATLEMSVSSDGGRGGAGNHRENGEEAPFFSERLAAHSYDASSGEAGGSAALPPASGGAGRQVDVLA
jgi:flagellar hook-length control protein FliK